LAKEIAKFTVEIPAQLWLPITTLVSPKAKSMAESAGLVIGGASLAGLFTTCIDCYKYRTFT